MGTIEETKKRLEISKCISSQLEGIVKGVLLGGSMGFGQNYSVNENSDLDQVIVCDKNRIRELNSTDYFSGEIETKVLRSFENGKINLFWVSKYVNDVEVNTFIYETKGYRDFCLMKGDIKGYSNHKPSEIQENYDFEGNLIQFNRKARSFGNGWIYEKPSLTEGKFFGAPPRDDFTRGFYIVHQEDFFFSELNEKVWDGIIKQLIKEHGPKVDLTKTNILNSEFVYQTKPDKLSKTTIERIKSKTFEKLSKYATP